MYLKRYQAYLLFEKRYSEHTVKAYTNDLTQVRDFLLQTFGIPEIHLCNHHHIRSWIVSLMMQDMKARSVNRKISSLKSYFRFLKREGMISTNPTGKIISPRMEQQLPVTISEKCLVRLLDTDLFADDFAGIRDKLVIEMLYHTGMRRSELINLKIAGIDVSNRRLRVTGKGNKMRQIAFGQKLGESMDHYLQSRVEAFGPYRPEDFLLVTNHGQKAYPKLLYNIVHKYIQQVSSAERISPHVLRHSFATHLMNAGAELNAVKELLGHASLASTQVYTHNAIERLKHVYQQAHPRSETR